MSYENVAAPYCVRRRCTALHCYSEGARTLQAIDETIELGFERRTVNPQVPGSSPGRGANLHAGFGGFCGLVSFRKTDRVPQFCGLFVLIGIGPAKQCPVKLQCVPFKASAYNLGTRG